MIELNELDALTSKPAEQLEAAKAFSILALYDDSLELPIIPRLIQNVKSILKLLHKNQHELFIYHVLSLFKVDQEVLFEQEQAIECFIESFGLNNVVRFTLENLDSTERLEAAKAFTFEELCDHALELLIVPQVFETAKAFLCALQEANQDEQANQFLKNIKTFRKTRFEKDLNPLVVSRVFLNVKAILEILQEENHEEFITYILEKHEIIISDINDFLTLLGMLPKALRYPFIEKRHSLSNMDRLTGHISTDMFERSDKCRIINSFISCFGLEKVLSFIQKEEQINFLDILTPGTLKAQIPDNNPERLKLFLNFFTDETSKRRLLEILQVEWARTRLFFNEKMSETIIQSLNLADPESLNYCKEHYKKYCQSVFFVLNERIRNERQQKYRPLTSVLHLLIHTRKSITKVLVSYIEYMDSKINEVHSISIEDLQRILKILLAFQSFSHAIYANEGTVILPMWETLNIKMGAVKIEIKSSSSSLFQKGTGKKLLDAFFKSITNEMKKQGGTIFSRLRADSIDLGSTRSSYSSMLGRDSDISATDLSVLRASMLTKIVEENTSTLRASEEGADVSMLSSDSSPYKGIKSIVDESNQLASPQFFLDQDLPFIDLAYMAENIFTDSSLKQLKEQLEKIEPQIVSDKNEPFEGFYQDTQMRSLAEAIALVAERTDSLAFEVLQVLLMYLYKLPLSVFEDPAIQDGLARGLQLSAYHFFNEQYLYLRQENTTITMFSAFLKIFLEKLSLNDEYLADIKHFREQIIFKAMKNLMFDLSFVDLLKMIEFLCGSEDNSNLTETEILSIYFDALFSMLFEKEFNKIAFNHCCATWLKYLEQEKKSFKSQIIASVIVKYILNYSITDLEKMMSILKGTREQPLLTEKEMASIFFNALLLIDTKFSEKSTMIFTNCFLMLINYCTTQLAMSPPEIFSLEMEMDFKKLSLWRESFLSNGPDCGVNTTPLIEFFCENLNNEPEKQKEFAEDCMRKWGVDVILRTISSPVLDCLSLEGLGFKKVESNSSLGSLPNEKQETRPSAITPVSFARANSSSSFNSPDVGFSEHPSAFFQSSGKKGWEQKREAVELATKKGNKDSVSSRFSLSSNYAENTG